MIAGRRKRKSKGTHEIARDTKEKKKKKKKKKEEEEEEEKKEAHRLLPIDAGPLT